MFHEKILFLNFPHDLSSIYIKFHSNMTYCKYSSLIINDRQELLNQTTTKLNSALKSLLQSLKLLLEFFINCMICTLLGFSFIGLLRQYLAHFQDHPSVTLVSRALLGFLFIQLLRQYLVHFQGSSSSTVTLEFQALLGFLFIRVLRQYLAHF